MGVSGGWWAECDLLSARTGRLDLWWSLLSVVPTSQQGHPTQRVSCMSQLHSILQLVPSTKNLYHYMADALPGRISLAPRCEGDTPRPRHTSGVYAASPEGDPARLA